MADEDVRHYWSLVSANWSEEETSKLSLISKKWMNVRGFSSASAFVEKYKQATKKTVQKSKGLRKNLINDHSDLNE